jgi:hypothetical protein
MKNLLIGILLIGICAEAALAADPCEYSRSTYVVCAGDIDGETFYVIHSFPCEKIDWYVLDFYKPRTLDQAKKERDMRNASEYASCQTDRRFKASKREWDKIIWKEIK